MAGGAGVDRVGEVAMVDGGSGGSGGGIGTAAPPADRGDAGGVHAVSGRGQNAGGGGGGEIAVARPDSSRGPDGLVAVGLDVGTGWTKVSALGRQKMFPSLYSCTYAPSAGDADILKDADDKGGRPKVVLRDAVGEEAAAMATGRFATLIRPVKHGVPHDGRGYSRIAAEALRAVGVDDASKAVVCAGVPYDARADRDRIKKLITAAVAPAYCMVLPQAYGTLKACGLKAGTVVNIGHGTTEIMRVGAEGMYAVSIQKASEFVLQQLAQRQGRTGRDAYTDHDAVLRDDPRMTARLVELLAVHIADEIQQLGAPAASTPSSAHSAGMADGAGGGGTGGTGAKAAGAEIILSGGGSRLPGMAKAIEKALGDGAFKVRMIEVDEPSFSNAIGLELTARDKFEAAQKALATRKAATGHPTSLSSSPPHTGSGGSAKGRAGGGATATGAGATGDGASTKRQPPGVITSEYGSSLET